MVKRAKIGFMAETHFRKLLYVPFLFFASQKCCLAAYKIVLGILKLKFILGLIDVILNSKVRKTKLKIVV